MVLSVRSSYQFALCKGTVFKALLISLFPNGWLETDRSKDPSQQDNGKVVFVWSMQHSRIMGALNKRLFISHFMSFNIWAYIVRSHLTLPPIYISEAFLLQPNCLWMCTSKFIVVVPIVSLFLFGQVLFDAVSSLVFCSCFFLPFVLVCKEGLSKALCERKVLGPWPGLFLKMWQGLWSQELPATVPVSLGSHPDHPTPSHTDRKPSLTQRPLHTKRNFL